MKRVSASEAIADLTDQHLRPETKTCRTDDRYWHLTKPGESYKHAAERVTGKEKLYSHVKFHPDQPVRSLTTIAGTFKHWSERRLFSYKEWIRFGSFPDDYKVKSAKIGQYMIGMSVPPKMTEYVARCVAEQWLQSRGSV